MKDTLRDIYDAVDEFFSGMGSRRLTTYSSSCAYYLFMSLVPVIMLLVSVLQYTPLTRDVVLEAVADYVPDSLYEIVYFIVTSIYNGGRVALTVSILLTIWSASACMKALLRGMDSVYDAERKEDYIRFSLRACFYMIIFVFILMLSFFVMVYGGKILDYIEQSMPVNHSLDFLFTLAKYLRFVIILALLALVFCLLYKWMPARRLKFRRQLPGAVFSSVAWAAFSFIFSFYVSLSDRFGAYGYIGTIMVAMIWIFYCFYFLLLGGFINHYIEMKRAEPEHDRHKRA
ncbi:MAG TPA: YihY/virulence factor BrkB family protein [Candidatus Scatomorpha intestinigallinarum]|uniref:YihY/virulence factor BrkB family protein n=1 Tax=Candidatus Scatomorpha intestinigallinarum TaxID=2840923 RepID=A0A9D1DMY9_9FIRM|nr:YihY/virulence factor BrkB family protein [Candidatus Scatomorpha intestinigallinarum]